MLKIIRSITISAFCIALMILPGCSDSNTHNPANPQGPGLPVVTWMLFNDELNHTIGVWGDTRVPDVITYPNPFSEYLNIMIRLPSSGTLRIWVVKAYGPGEEYDPMVSAAGGYAYVPYGLPVRVLIDDRWVPDGVAGLVWNLDDDEGNPLPSGFYRIYASLNRSLFWGDVFLAHQCADIPVYFNIPRCE